MSDFEPKLLLNKTLTARTLGISVQAFTNWGLKPHQRTAREALYYLPTVIEELLRRRVPDQDAELDLEQERARLASEQADKTALENAEHRGELADLDTIAEELGHMLASFRARLLAAPSKLAPLVNPENPNLARDIIAGEHERILAELAAYQPGTGSIEYAGDAAGDPAASATAAPANGKRVGGPAPPAQPRKQRGARSIPH